MSKMGNLVLDIQERYEDGESIENIAKATGTSVTFVKQTIHNMFEDEFDGYPEPDSDFG